MNFPEVTKGVAPLAHLYEIVPYISIYSSHIHSLLENCSLSAFGIAPSYLRSRHREMPTALARQMAMYLAHVAFGLNYTEVGSIFARDRTTVAHACALIEDLRDDPVLDRALSALEAVLPSLCFKRP